jgi:large subunit ribosomal protein L29
VADALNKAKDVRALSSEDIKSKVAEFRRRLYDLRSQSVTENLKNPCELLHTRKAIARMLTILSERERQARAEAAKPAAGK